MHYTNYYMGSSGRLGLGQFALPCCQEARARVTGTSKAMTRVP